MPRPFDGVRVLDLTHVIAGPFCTYQLAVLGADVVKIEPPGEPDCARGRGPDAAQNAALRGLNFQVQGGNKRALAIDLKDQRGRAVLLRLAARADVLVENYRVGALAALGLDDAALESANPALIRCSITGFGHEGPRSTVNAYETACRPHRASWRAPERRKAVRSKRAPRSLITRPAGARRSRSRRRCSSASATGADSGSTARCSMRR
jgi:crotonobetainyl-CoA:carnitine CoA-transferase CaiB-like acyl-CoA transferase